MVNGLKPESNKNGRRENLVAKIKALITLNLYEHRKRWPSHQNASAYVPHGRDKGRDRFVALKNDQCLNSFTALRFRREQKTPTP
jgi:hypothetical protein